MKLRTIQLLAAWLGILFFSVSNLKAVNQYTATEINLGTNLSPATFGADINKSGQIVMCTGTTQCYLYKNGQLSTITFPDPIYGMHINDNGQIIAQTGYDKSYLYTNGSLQMLNFSSYSINNQGAIAGSNFNGTAFIYQNGVKTIIPGVFGAYGINNNNAVVGSKENIQFQWSGYLYSNGSVTDLPTTGYTYYIDGEFINNNGQIVGTGYYDLYNRQSFLYENGSMRFVGLLPGTHESIASDLNNNGQIVGWCDSGWSPFKSFIYEDGTLKNLTAMVNLPGGYLFSKPLAINDSGSIIGFARDPQSQWNVKAYLLSPVPEPTTLLLLGLGGILIRKRKQQSCLEKRECPPVVLSRISF